MKSCDVLDTVLGEGGIVSASKVILWSSMCDLNLGVT